MVTAVSFKPYKWFSGDYCLKFSVLFLCFPISVRGSNELRFLFSPRRPCCIPPSNHLSINVGGYRSERYCHTTFAGLSSNILQRVVETHRENGTYIVKQSLILYLQPCIPRTTVFWLRMWVYSQNRGSPCSCTVCVVKAALRIKKGGEKKKRNPPLTATLWEMQEPSSPFLLLE